MPYYSKEQIAAAREMDLLTYLQRYEPEELVHVGGNVYSTRSHGSLKISNGKWKWWSQDIGGKSALDYLIKVRGLRLPEAMRILAGAPAPPTPMHTAAAREEKTEPTTFTLPKKHADNRRVFAYLCRRGLDPEIINHCIKGGQLYEDAKHHNCVFVGFDGDRQPRYATLRGTLSESSFKGDVGGSDKRFSFAVPLQAQSPTLCVFESAIDALSYLTLLKQQGKDWRRANVLSLSGVFRPGENGSSSSYKSLEQYLGDNPQVGRVVLCLDADEAGRTASQAIGAALESTGRYEVIDNPPGAGKDYNELLQMVKAIESRQREQPQRGG